MEKNNTIGFWDIFEEFSSSLNVADKNRESDFGLLTDYYFKFTQINYEESCLNNSAVFKILIPLKSVFNDQVFLDVLYRVIEQENIATKGLFGIARRGVSTKTSVEYKQFIKQRILIGFIPFSLYSSVLNREQVVYAKRIIKQFVLELSNNLSIDQSFVSRILQDILLESAFNFKGTFSHRLSRSDSDGFYDFLKFVSAVSGITMAFLFSFTLLSESLRKQVRILSGDLSLPGKDGKPSLRIALNSIFQLVFKINVTTKSFQGRFDDKSKYREIFEVYKNLLIGRNEKNIVYIFSKICDSFNPQQNRVFFEIILEKISKAASIKQEIQKECEKNLSFFNKDIATEGIYTEWSNKVYLVTIKMLAYFEVLSRSFNDSWKVAAATNELNIWVEEVNKIINALEMDDWDKLKEYIKGESDIVEWKTSFKIATEKDASDNITEKVVFQSIVKNIVAMANTDGGSILVGMVEYPERIKNARVKEWLLEKNGYIFLDITKEFSYLKSNHDEIFRQILLQVALITEKPQDFFNNLVEMSDIKIRDEKNGNDGTIYLISVKKSSEPLFFVEKSEQKTNISIMKRANGTICYDDPRKYLC